MYVETVENRAKLILFFFNNTGGPDEFNVDRHKMLCSLGRQVLTDWYILTPGNRSLPISFMWWSNVLNTIRILNLLSPSQLSCSKKYIGWCCCNSLNSKCSRQYHKHNHIHHFCLWVSVHFVSYSISVCLNICFNVSFHIIANGRCS